MNWVDVATHNEWQFYNETGIAPVPKELRGVDEMLVASADELRTVLKCVGCLRR